MNSLHLCMIARCGPCQLSVVKNKREDTIFKQKPQWNLHDRVIHFDDPCIMGIINLTDDSFYESSRVLHKEAFISKALGMVQSGADILDIGAQSTRPGSTMVAAADELKRIEQALDWCREIWPSNNGPVLSVDTYYHSVAERAMEKGAHLINDVSGGRLDGALLPWVISNKIPYVLMHSRGTPADMQQLTDYRDVTKDVFEWLREQMSAFHNNGWGQVVIDPGIGFAKNDRQNFQLLKNASTFLNLQVPVMYGVSRKSFIQRAIGSEVSQALNGTTAIHSYLIQCGVNILRVHDVTECKETVVLMKKLFQEE